MAIKALGQISIVDLTDGYTVSLDQDAGSFPADSSYKALNTSTVFTINVTGLQGSESITNNLKIGTCVIKDSTGAPISNGSITATTATGNKSPVTVTVYGGSGSSAFTGEMATVTIPVYVEGDPSDSDTSTDVIINKIFTISAAAQGTSGVSSYTYIRYAEDAQGTGMTANPSDSKPYMGIAVTNSSTAPTNPSAYAPWTKYLGEDGADGVSFYIESSNGTYFKNTGVNTRLTVHIRKADGTEDTIPDNLEWYKGDPNNGGTKVTVTAHRQYIDISAGDVTNTATYFVVLETNE